MTVLNDELHVAEWITSKVTTATGLKAYFGAIPADADFPAIRFHVQARHDVMGVGTARIITHLTWLVAVVNKDHSLVPLITPADQIDAALHNQSGATSTISVLSCVRESPFTQLDPEDSGVYYRHAGGLYRTVSQPL
jgi:hypothetical protein